MPAGVVGLVYGNPAEISSYLIPHPVIRKISFTGSTAVGKQLAALAGLHMKRVTMELGGHAPVLVFADCDLQKTLDAVVPQKFRNAGQVCVSPTRFYVQEAIYDRFIAGFAERAKAVTTGHGLAAETKMGPLANARRPGAIAALVDDAAAKGARVMAGGKRGEGVPAHAVRHIFSLSAIIPGENDPRTRRGDTKTSWDRAVYVRADSARAATALIRRVAEGTAAAISLSKSDWMRDVV